MTWVRSHQDVHRHYVLLAKLLMLDRNSEDASATYRGYRNQALYVLARLLTDANSEQRIYRPEGAEDLAVFDSSQRLIDVVQVKDYSSDLALSHFKPSRPDGFFARFKRRRIDHPHCVTRLASFGPLGPELSGAIAGDAPIANLSQRPIRFTLRMTGMRSKFTSPFASPTPESLLRPRAATSWPITRLGRCVGRRSARRDSCVELAGRRRHVGPARTAELSPAVELGRGRAGVGQSDRVRQAEPDLPRRVVADCAGSRRA